MNEKLWQEILRRDRNMGDMPDLHHPPNSTRAAADRRFLIREVERLRKELEEDALKARTAVEGAYLTGRAERRRKEQRAEPAIRTKIVRELKRRGAQAMADGPADVCRCDVARVMELSPGQFKCSTCGERIMPEEVRRG